jgi:hypothetical protein
VAVIVQGQKSSNRAMAISVHRPAERIHPQVAGRSASTGAKAPLESIGWESTLRCGPSGRGLTHHRCSDGNQEVPPAGGNAEVGKTNDINPQDLATLQQGGKPAAGADRVSVELQLTEFDGNEADSGAMLRATMPRAFRVAAGRDDDGQHRLLHRMSN